MTEKKDKMTKNKVKMTINKDKVTEKKDKMTENKDKMSEQKDKMSEKKDKMTEAHCLDSDADGHDGIPLAAAAANHLQEVSSHQQTSSSKLALATRSMRYHLWVCGSLRSLSEASEPPSRLCRFH